MASWEGFRQNRLALNVLSRQLAEKFMAAAATKICRRLGSAGCEPLGAGLIVFIYILVYTRISTKKKYKSTRNTTQLKRKINKTTNPEIAKYFVII